MGKRKRSSKSTTRRMFKRWKKRTKSSTRKRRKALSVIPRPVKCFPNSMKFTMRYCDNITIPNHNAGAGPYCFRMNSIFDPDHTGVGHQPRFHDQVAGIYHKYCVIGARAYIELLSSGTSSVAGGIGNPTVFAYLDDSAVADSRSLEQHIELGMPNSAYIMTTIPGSSNNRIELSRAKRSFAMNYGLRKFWGVDKKTQVIYPTGTGVGDEYVEESNFAAMFGTNPAKQCILKLKVFDSALTGDQASVYARVTIDYQVVAFAPIEVGAS